MTHRQPPQPPDDDAAISAAVANLMAAHGESVVDLAHFTKISVASLYRKLGGDVSWKASDIGTVARHYDVLPGDLFAGAAHPVLGRSRGSGRTPNNRTRTVSTHRYMRTGPRHAVLCLATNAA